MPASGHTQPIDLATATCNAATSKLSQLNIDFILFWRGAIVTDSHDEFTNTRQYFAHYNCWQFQSGPINSPRQLEAIHNE
jgi:hypothetical protein